MTKCVNGTSSGSWQPVCDTPENIKTGTTQSSRISFILTNTILNPELVTNTAQSFLDSQIYSVQPDKMYTTANILLNQQTMVTDTSILPIESYQQDNFIIYTQNDYKQSFSVGTFPNFCEIYFLRSSFSTIIQRNYAKLEEVIGRIGGFSQVFLIIAAIIVNYYNEVVYTIELANRLYDFDIQRDAKSKKIQVLRDSNNQPKINSKKFSNQTQQTQVSEKEPSYYFDRKSQIIAQKSLNPDGKVLNREDLGLAPLEEIKQKLESIKSPKKKRTLCLNRASKGNLEQFQGLNSDMNSHTLNHLLGKTGHIEYNNEEALDLDQSNPNQKDRAKQKTYDDSEVFQKKNNENLDELSLTLCKNNTQEQQEGQLMTSPPIDSIPNLIPLNLTLMLKQSLKKFSSQDKTIQKIEQDLKQGIVQVQTPIQKARVTVDKGLQDPNTFFDKELRFIIQRDRSLKPSIKYVINKLTCGKLFNTEVIQMLSKADDMIRKDLDIFNILERLKELEKLKKLFFNHEQQMLFNFFPKPLIHIDKQQKHITRQNMKEKETENQLKSLKMLQKKSKALKINKTSLSAIYKAVMKLKKMNKKSQLSEYQELFHCYEKIISNYQNDAEQIFNQKLVELLGNEMKNIFEITQMMKERINDKEQSGQMMQNLRDSFNLNNIVTSSIEDQQKTKLNVTQQKSVFNKNFKETIYEEVQNNEEKLNEKHNNSQKQEQNTEDNQENLADQIIIFDENETESCQSK